jgi:metallo-beta-lactamase superfamily protein
MPPRAHDFHRLTPALFAWQTYDPAVKADLFSSAIATSDGIWVVDPVPLLPNLWQTLCEIGPVAGIVVTNANHRRASVQFARDLNVAVFGQAEALAALAISQVRQVRDGETIGNELEVISLEGAAAGEIALYCSADGGTFIVGDALINFEPYGFSFLPRKYCLDEKQMRRSLAKLLSRKAERMLFAHGAPILSGASTRLEQLLEGNC